MVLPVPDLPDNVDALKAMISAMAEERAANEARLAVAATEIARLEAAEKSANERIANLTSILVSGCLKLRVFGAEDCTRLVLGCRIHC